MQADGVVTANEVLDLIDECTRFIVTGSSCLLFSIFGGIYCLNRSWLALRSTSVNGVQA